MSYTNVLNLQNGDKTLYNGKECTITSNTAAFYTIKDEDGNYITVPKSSPLFDYSKLIYENNTYIDKLRDKVYYYNTLKLTARAEEKNVRAQMNSLRKDWGVRLFSQMDSEQKEIFGGLRKKAYVHSGDAIYASNRMYSLYNSILDFQLDNHDLINQQSIFGAYRQI